MRRDFTSLRPDDTLETILKTFAANRITSAPVLDGPVFMGIVSDIEIVKYFTARRVPFLWQSNKPTPVGQLRKVIVEQLAKRPATILSPEQPLISVLPKIVMRTDCIPVLQNKQLVGLIRGEDIVNFFLTELARDAAAQTMPPAGGLEAAAAETGQGTEIDRILEIVRAEGRVPVSVLSRRLGISQKTLEGLCESLQRHYLLTMRYSLTKGTIIERNPHEKA